MTSTPPPDPAAPRSAGAVWRCVECGAESTYAQISHTTGVCTRVKALFAAEAAERPFDEPSERIIDALCLGPRWNLRTYDPAMRPLMDAGYVFLSGGLIGLTLKGAKHLRSLEIQPIPRPEQP